MFCRSEIFMFERDFTYPFVISCQKNFAHTGDHYWTHPLVLWPFHRLSGGSVYLASRHPVLLWCYPEINIQGQWYVVNAKDDPEPRTAELSFSCNPDRASANKYHHEVEPWPLASR